MWWEQISQSSSILKWAVLAIAGVILAARIVALFRSPGSNFGFLAVGGSFVLGYLLRQGFRSLADWELMDCSGWLWVSTVVLAVHAIGMTVAGRPAGTGWTWQTLVFAGFAVMSLRPIWQNDWGVWEAAGKIGGMVAGFAALRWGIGWWLWAVGDRMTGVCLLPLGISACALPSLTGYRTLGELALIPLAAWTGVILASWRLGRPSMTAGAVQAGLFIAAGVWICSWAYSEAPMSSVVALALTPAVGLLIRIPWVRGGGVFRRGGVLAAAVWICLVLVLTPLVSAFLRATAELSQDRTYLGRSAFRSVEERTSQTEEFL